MKYTGCEKKSFFSYLSYSKNFFLSKFFDLGPSFLIPPFLGHPVLIRILSGLNQFYHPIVQFAEEKVSLSVNTGMPVITGTGLNQEIGLLKTWGLTETHLTKAVFNSARAAFLEDKKKKELQKELRKVNISMCSKCKKFILFFVSIRLLEWRIK